jgi:hypothetical protein
MSLQEPIACCCIAIRLVDYDLRAGSDRVVNVRLPLYRNVSS